jgi:predicted deacylase
MADRLPIEISPPDLSRYRAGNTGVDYVHVLDSGRPGASVMVQALTHGNEFSGAIALDTLWKDGLRPVRGTLTLAFANIAAYERFDPEKPSASRCIDEDYNRVWSDEVLDGPRDSLELRRARELRRFVDAADYLLDLHSMSEPCRPIMVCGTSEKSVAFARRIGMPADLLIDTGHASGLRMIERGAFGDPQSPRAAVLIESGQHWEKSAVDVAFDTTLRFLTVTGVVDEAWAQPRLRLPLPAVQRLVRVTEAVVAKSMQFRFARPWKGLEVVPGTGTPIAYDGETVWRTAYDDCVMVMPGTANLKPGNTTVRLGRFEA